MRITFHITLIGPTNASIFFQSQSNLKIQMKEENNVRIVANGNPKIKKGEKQTLALI